MEVTLSLGQLKAVEASLKLLSNSKTKAWYGVAKNLQRVKNHSSYYDSMYDKIVETLAERDEQGNLVTNPEDPGLLHFNSEENKATFLKAVDSLMAEEVTVDFHQIKYSTIEDESHVPGIFAVLDEKVFVD